MKLTFSSIRLFYFLAGVSWLAIGRPAQATEITAGPSLTNTNIASESNNATNGTTVQFTLDSAGQAEVDFFQVSPVDSSQSKVASIIKTYASGGPQSIFWNALWLIGTDFGRHDGRFAYQVIPSTGSTIGTAQPPTNDPNSFFNINSVDVHNLTVTPSLDANQQPTFPYIITYSLAKGALVTAQIYDSSNTVVRTLLSSKLQAGETDSISSNTITWDGLKADGTPAPIGIYVSSISAVDSSTKDQAIPRTKPFSVTSLAGAAVSDPQKLFETNVYVFPNPVRNGKAFFNALRVRDGATIRLRIYTITGTLVLDQDITSQLPYQWNVTNQSGNKLGRGLYYYVMREDDPQGTLQVTKKMAVLP